MSQTFWKFWAWFSIACGLAAYGVGWYDLLAKTEVWGIPAAFLFFDAIAAAMFGVFFLIYAAHWGKK